ncbi:MAG: glycosyltransferase family 9 protein [Acidobacteriota bacterium]
MNQRLLLIRLRSLGDTVLMTPLPAVAKRVPGCEVAVVVEEPFDQVLRGNPHIDRLFTIPARENKWISRLRILSAIRSYRPETAIDLHGGTTSALIALCSGARRRVGYAQGRNARYYNEKVPPFAQVWGRNSLHTVLNQLAFLKHLGFPVEPIPPLQVAVDEQELASMRRRLLDTGVNGSFILIHPSATFDTKQWEPGKFAQLASRLSAEGSTVVMTVGPGEEALLRKIETASSRTIHLIEPLPLSQFTALVKLAHLYIGNDTGPMHIAAALGKKIVAVFGSSNSDAWYPWGVEHKLIKSDLPCIPCPGYYCLHYAEPLCIRSIEVEPVLRAARSLL